MDAHTHLLLHAASRDELQRAAEAARLGRAARPRSRWRLSLWPSRPAPVAPPPPHLPPPRPAPDDLTALAEPSEAAATAPAAATR